jgi:adenine-specific DNA-methyltransferase
METNYIYHGDCMELLKKLPSNSVDCIITDPPYNVLALDWDKQEVDWKALAEEFYRVLKVNGCIYIFGQMPMINLVFVELSKKFKFKQDLVWYKNRGFSLVNTIFTKYHENILFFVKGNEEILKSFGKRIKEKRLELGISLKQIGELCDEKWYHRGGHMYYETGLACPTKEQYDKLMKVLGLDIEEFNFLFDRPTFNFEDIKLDGEPYKITRKEQKVYGVKSNMGEFTQINNGKRNPKTVLEYPIIQSGKEYFGHPTQKPKDLIKYLIQSCSNENDIILDPFMGSGTTAKACEELNRRWVGAELDENYISMINKRLSQQTLSNLSGFIHTSANADPKGAFNKDLTATQQVASPKCPSDTSLNPDIKLNSQVLLQARQS